MNSNEEYLKLNITVELYSKHAIVVFFSLFGTSADKFMYIGIPVLPIDAFTVEHSAGRVSLGQDQIGKRSGFN